jgi:phosphoribosyl-ATP pyrophosphohydrolase/phosphoribosyl-AMP cyclohydrolase/histidinol dehydrogenase
LFVCFLFFFFPDTSSFCCCCCCCCCFPFLFSITLLPPATQQATLAAAHLAGVDGFICVGGAQAIAAMTYGVGIIPCADVIVGPGNRWVTAAKKLVSGRVGIDMLAGPSECLVLADNTANPATIAADLLAQAEHDTDARPILVTTESSMIERVNEEIKKQLETLPTGDVARVAVERAGFAMVAKTMKEAMELVDRIAPEHLEIMTADSSKDSQSLLNYGGLFIGHQSAEVMGDYGAGPNHVLPTGGTGRYTGGLSVFTFLAIRTFMELDASNKELKLVAMDAVTVARVEGLEGHARAAELRLPEEERPSKRQKN